MKKKASIIWCTGMSGVGKTTLVDFTKIELTNHGFSVLILDGDVVRDSYKTELGFGNDDIKKNNLYIASLCLKERYNYDAIFVPIISPLEVVRCKVRKILSPKFHLVYIHADIESLKDRDPKGLYKKADNGLVTNLIGCSKNNPYEIPTDYDLLVNTSNKSDINKSKEEFKSFVLENL